VPTSLYWLYGTFENVVGSGQSDLITGSDRAEILLGMGGADVTFAGGGNDVIAGGQGNDFISGGGGVDLALYQGLRSQSNIVASATSIAVTGSEGSDTLTDVERVQFTDVGVAFDLGGGAGMTAKLLGAVFGPGAIHNETFVAIGLSYFDSGWTYLQVANLALDAALGSTRSNASVFDLLYFNTVGAHSDAATASYWIGQLQGGAMTQAQLATFAAEMDLNLANIGYANMASTGIVYAV
jgi:serralysin